MTDKESINHKALWRERERKKGFMKMKNKSLIKFLFIGLIIGGLFQAANAQSRNEQLLINRAVSISGDRFEVFTTTQRGVKIYAVREPNAATLQAIDTGFVNLFAIARKNGYSKRTNFSDYTVFIANADRTKDSGGNYSPDLAVPSGQYAGSDYDKGGYIYAAGMVLAFNPSAFIFAEHEKNLERISDVVRFEGEHIILYYNNRSLYNKTADHSRGGGHPIMQ